VKSSSTATNSKIPAIFRSLSATAKVLAAAQCQHGRKKPIAPGGTGEINVEFNSKGKPGQQHKQVTVTANTTPTETFLVIKGNVRGKEQPVSKGGK
jgi:hypothetical protein